MKNSKERPTCRQTDRPYSIRTIPAKARGTKIVKNTHEGVLPSYLLKATLFHGWFLHFSNCVNGTKLHKASHLISFLTKNMKSIGY